MCRSKDNSLEANLASQARMLREGVVPLDRMPRLRADAEGAERAYSMLMEQSDWTPEELLEITGYHLLGVSNHTA